MTISFKKEEFMDLNNPHKVKREKLIVVIITEDYKVEGEVHIQPAGRLTDYVNSQTSENFIAVTNAVITSLSQISDPLKVDYLALNKKDIIMIYPLSS